MKILFVDAGDHVQEKWIEPLRAAGWGVIRARSEVDASKFLAMHGSTVRGVVTHERFAGFGAKAAIPLVVMTEKGSPEDLQKFRKSAPNAIACLPHSSDFKSIIDVFSGKPASSPSASPEKTRTGMRLVEATGIFSQPESTRTGSLSLKSPLRVLGGGTSAAIARQPVISEVSEVLEPAVAEPVFSLEPAAESVVEPDSGIMVTQATEGLNLDDLSSGPVASLLEEGSDSGAGILDFEGLTRQGPPPSLALAPSPVAESSPDLETLKSYLTMREQDVAVLSGQLRSAKDRAQQLELLIKAEKARNAEIQEMLSKAEQKLKSYDLEKQVELEVMNKQIEDMSGHLKDKTEKARVIETKLRLMSEEVNKVKDRVRVDIRRIRVREKELEGQLEILKKDSGALLLARDEKILELKRRIDLLEFNMELVQEQYDKERKSSDELRLKLKDAAQAMKQANGFLEQ
ncbi:MAG: hypothetical protein EBX52_00090 [Proteobacteria bacterium]|nr:hypothetical protein [Pseudomonadota bacterium]